MTNQEEIYPTICYLVLITNRQEGDNLFHHPSYVLEKVAMLNAGLDAFTWLDDENQKKVLDYLNYWKVEVPEVWQKHYDAAVNAKARLGML